jgi:hypothetical protein
VRVVAEADTRRLLRDRGAVFVWPRAVRCCGGRQWLLEASTERPDQEFELVHAADGFQVYASCGLAEPDELHLELSRRGDLRAYWNGLGWIG